MVWYLMVPRICTPLYRELPLALASLAIRQAIFGGSAPVKPAHTPAIDLEELPELLGAVAACEEALSDPAGNAALGLDVREHI